MSETTLSAALGDAAMHFNEGDAEQEAISHTVDERPCPSLQAEAISHKNDEGPMQQGRKRKGAVRESSGNSSGNHTIFSQEPPLDRAVDCIFVDDECIPLWPQYACTVSEGTFLRLGDREAWWMQMFAACKKTLDLPDNLYKPEPRISGLHCSRLVGAEFIRYLVGKLRAAVATAKKKYPKRARHTFPEVMTFRIEGCDVRASTRTRNFHILVGPEARHWITSGLRVAISRHIGSTIQATSQLDPQCSESPCLQYLNYRNSVQGKVHWVPANVSWALSTTEGEEAVNEYCSKASLSLAVNPNLSGKNFLLERKKAFDVACRVWNAVDKSSRHRIPMVVESSLDLVTVTALSQPRG